MGHLSYGQILQQVYTCQTSLNAFKAKIKSGMLKSMYAGPASITKET